MSFDPNQTQPTRVVKRDNNKTLPTNNQNPTFGIGSVILLLALVWAADALGTVLPGPVDDILYDLIGTLTFGFIQYLRLKMPLLLEQINKWLNKKKS